MSWAKRNFSPLSLVISIGEALTTSEQDERRLVEAAQADPERFVELYDRHFSHVWAFVVRRASSRTEAEDITSEVFRKALENLPRYEWRGPPFKAWLFRIAANTLATRWQKTARESGDMPPDVAEAGIDLERHAMLFELVHRLPSVQRQVIELRFIEGRTLLEIAAALSKSEGAVKQLQKRALDTLRAGRRVMPERNWHALETVLAAIPRSEFRARLRNELEQKEVTMSTVTSASVEDQKRAIDNWAAHWSTHDMDRLLPLFTEDVVYEDVTMGVVNRGPAQLRVFGEGIFSAFPDVTWELRSSFANGISGGAEWVMRATHKGDLPGMPATGKRIEVRGASVFEFAGDKIRRCTDYWDMATCLKQMDLMPSA